MGRNPSTRVLRCRKSVCSPEEAHAASKHREVGAWAEQMPPGQPLSDGGGCRVSLGVCVRDMSPNSAPALRGVRALVLLQKNALSLTVCLPAKRPEKRLRTEPLKAGGRPGSTTRSGSLQADSAPGPLCHLCWDGPWRAEDSAIPVHVLMG